VDSDHVNFVIPPNIQHTLALENLFLYYQKRHVLKPSINKFPWFRFSCAVFIKLGNKLERKFEQSDNKGLINLISLSRNVVSLTSNE
jgi:hypothetical protein